MSQTSIDLKMTAAREGMIVDAIQTDSFVAKVAFAPGRFLVRDETSGDEKSVRPPVLTGEVTGKLAAGFSAWIAARTPADPNYSVGDMVTVLRKGRIWLRSEDAAALSDSVFVRFSSSGAEEDGAIRTDADTADAVARPGLTFLTKTLTAAGLILVDVNL